MRAAGALFSGLLLALGTTAGGSSAALAQSLERGLVTKDDPFPTAGETAPVGIWTKLHYRGKNWLAHFSAELEMEGAGNRSETAGGPDVDGWVASLRTNLGSFLLEDRSTRLRAYFDPITGSVARLTQLSLGSSPDLKRYVFEATGVRRTRIEPDPGQSVEDPDRWPDRPSELHAHDAKALGCRLVSSPAVLAWWLTWGPGAGAPGFPDVGACHFLGKTLYRIEVERGRTGEARVDYQLLRAGEPSRRRGSVPVQHYAIVSRPIAGKMDEKTVLAEMEIDVETRLPWRFVMREGPFQIDANLERAVLGSSSPPAEGRTPERGVFRDGLGDARAGGPESDSKRGPR